MVFLKYVAGTLTNYPSELTIFISIAHNDDFIQMTNNIFDLLFGMFIVTQADKTFMLSWVVL